MEIKLRESECETRRRLEKSEEVGRLVTTVRWSTRLNSESSGGEIECEHSGDI